jgi:DUF971 family protein
MSPQALSSVLMLVFANDRDALRDHAVLRLLAPSAEWDRIERAADAIQRIWSKFDYCASPEFSGSAHGKSAAVMQYLRKLHEKPEPRRDARLRLERALSAGIDAPELRQLVPLASFEEIVAAFSLLRPDGPS